MSISLIAFQPSIEEPSNMKPSVSWSSSTTPATIERCCHLPFGIGEREVDPFDLLSLIMPRMVFASFATGLFLSCCRNRFRS
jgi:hypothetical protein